MTMKVGVDDDEGQAPMTSPTSPSSLRSTQNFFAVPRRGQLAGHGFITTPAHVRSPLAQTPSPVPSDDNPLSPGPSSLHAVAAAASPPPSPAASQALSEQVNNDDRRPPAARTRSQRTSHTSSSTPSITQKTQDDPVSWSDFLELYAQGKWDSTRPPPQPVALASSSSASGSTILLPPGPTRRKSVSAPPTASADSSSSSLLRPHITHKNVSDEARSATRSPPRLSNATRTQSSPEPTYSLDGSGPLVLTASGSSSTIVQRRGAEQLVLGAFSSPSISSLSKWAANQPKTPSPPIPGAPSSILAQPITPSAIVDAATVRWAGARVKVAPLSLSSPERELIDPLSDYIAGVPTPQQKAMAEYFTARTGTTPAGTPSGSNGKVGPVNNALTPQYEVPSPRRLYPPSFLASHPSAAAGIAEAAQLTPFISGLRDPFPSDRATVGGPTPASPSVRQPQEEYFPDVSVSGVDVTAPSHEPNSSSSSQYSPVLSSESVASTTLPPTPTIFTTGDSVNPSAINTPSGTRTPTTTTSSSSTSFFSFPSPMGAPLAPAPVPYETPIRSAPPPIPPPISRSRPAGVPTPIEESPCGLPVIGSAYDAPPPSSSHSTPVQNPSSADPAIHPSMPTSLQPTSGLDGADGFTGRRILGLGIGLPNGIPGSGTQEVALAIAGPENETVLAVPALGGVDDARQALTSTPAAYSSDSPSPPSTVASTAAESSPIEPESPVASTSQPHDTADTSKTQPKPQPHLKARSMPPGAAGQPPRNPPPLPFTRSASHAKPPVPMKQQPPAPQEQKAPPKAPNPGPIDLTKPREELLFGERNFLVAPYPPNELERRTALHKFNILHTAPDVNFDRIAHLAKLVFHARWVFITLVDKDEQFFKHAAGFSYNTGPRETSFCTHTILQESEPMVILNAFEDWRFANHPMVTTTADPSDPTYFKIGFYAGTPLRTVDGYNIGSLCVIDDAPRSEFGPRQRHALKEFGAIVMREMELWRDKVQLRIRDRIQTSMEQFTRECLELDGPASDSSSANLNPEENMKRVYSNAASLVKNTLDLEGAVVVDVSNFEVLHTTVPGPMGTSEPVTSYHGDFLNSTLSSSSSGSKVTLAPGSGTRNANRMNGANDSSDDALNMSSGSIGSSGDKGHEFGRIPALPVLGAAENLATPPTSRNEPLSGEAHSKLANFLATFPDGRIYERVVPSCFKGIVPNNLQYAMVVPIFNVDGQPFILLCGYTTDRTKHYLEGYEMQYLRAIGVIILSAVLKRRMKLADKAKSLFISNISHELRTPLHGILAAAELLADSGLTPPQQSYLQTVEACGTSLVETVNHVLDFSKLSGTTKSISMKRTTTDLISLLEDTVEGAWVGARARAVYGNADIGSAYSPPNKGVASPDGDEGKTPKPGTTVETVLDIGLRDEGWLLKCEKGGIRRVLMNLLGNSLKFTDAGFVHITLRELPEEPGSDKVHLELAVLDSGKGISKDFLKNQMFQPFSQENPLHTGTGLGLAIVNSIVKSEGVRGKVDVYSAEGLGTEIRVTIETERPSSRSSSSSRQISSDDGALTSKRLLEARVFPIAFRASHRGQNLLRDVLSSYVTGWWHATMVSQAADANVLLINEDMSVLESLIQLQDVHRPVVLLASNRGDNAMLKIISEFEAAGGRCYVVYKPVRPSHLYKALEHALSPPDRSAAGHADSLPALWRPPMTQRPSLFTAEEVANAAREAAHASMTDETPDNPPSRLTASPVVQRRYSEEVKPSVPRRPPLPHSVTHNHLGPSDALEPNTVHESSSKPLTGGLDLGRSPKLASKPGRVLVVEDNHVNRALLTQWLKKQGYEYEEAADGQVAVDVFNSRPAGHFDVVLIDMSMPVLDGAAAIQMIRSVEHLRNGQDSPRRDDEFDRSPSFTTPHRSKIFALSGLASKEDKLRAFNAGVDGYLVKPVSFKMLASVFARLEKPSA